ncbi:MAG: hypothetical protein JXJ22_09130 [Bacteroidales bacterium]|nr:hypothetical protein [Bacteroidales bacterium]
MPHRRILFSGLLLWIVISFAQTQTIKCSESFINSQTNVSYNPVMDNYDVKFYFLNLDVSDTSIYLNGSVTIKIESLLNDLDTLVFDLVNDLSIDSIVVDGFVTSFTHVQDEIKVFLLNPLEINQQAGITIYYKGYGLEGEWISGIRNSYVSNWDKNVTWTLSEPLSAKNWFPCKQSLTDKADSVYVYLTTDENRKAGSNGLLTKTVNLGNGKVRHEWKSRYPIAYYLISFTVCDYMDFSFYAKPDNTTDSILIQNYIYNDPAFLEQNQSNIMATGQMIELYSNLFGPYPFRNEKYGHCITPLGGGMEHQTMTTLGNFDFILVAHELTHQWFGDHVTCSTWQDIWINEGFASYGEYLANQYLKSQQDADQWILQAFNLIKSSSGGSVYIPEEETQSDSRVFDYRLTYKKGAAIIHMLRQEVDNDSLFFSMLQDFQSDFAGSNASGLDFKNFAEQKISRDFTAFFNQWYFGEGYPVLNINWKQNNDSLYIGLVQHSSAPDKTPVFDILIDYKLRLQNSDTIIRLRQNTNFQEFQIYFPETIQKITIDPHHWILAEIESVLNVSDILSGNVFTLFPNPAQNEVTLLFDNKDENYNILFVDQYGRILETIKHCGYRCTLDISDFPAGLYIIILDDKKMLHTAKLLKQ